MKYHLVVARYNENIDWITKINTNLYDIFIYNKGDKLDTNLNYNIINLDNIGRESHTYLFHIINNYDNLPEKIIFTQAHPFDHVRKTFINEINNFNNCFYNFFYFSKNILNIKYDINENKFIEFGNLDGNKWTNFHNIDSPISITMKKLFENFEEKNINLIFGTGAIYGVNKKLIMKNKKDFYIKCIDILNTSSNLKNPDEGHSFERLWCYIFNI